MKVSYKKYLNRSYMIISTNEKPHTPFEIQMVLKNKISGILPLQFIQKDDKYEFWYDITGKQSLHTFWEREDINADLLIVIMQTLKILTESIKSYMLNENCINLSDAFIFLTYPLDGIKFIYLPYESKNINKELKEFMELVLQKMDHGDERTVKVGYSMYQNSLQEGISIQKMLDDVQKEFFSESEEDVKEELKQTHIINSECDNTIVNEPKTNLRMRKSNKKDVIFRIMYNNIVMKIKEVKNRKIPIGIKQNKESYPVVITVEDAKKKEEPVSKTEYLGENQEIIYAKLIYHGVHNLHDIDISKDVFTLGKDKKEVDGWILHKSVSRCHAIIEQVKSEYYISDLNSTNGTYVNDKSLEYCDKVKIVKNDRIKFGTEEFIFH